MSVLGQNTLFVGLGGTGSRIVRDLDATATALRGPDSPSHQAVSSIGLDVQAFRREAAVALRRLMEAGAGSSAGQVRLDIAAVAVAEEVHPERLGALLGAIGELLVEDYPVVFPPDAPPEHRSVWMTLSLGTPPLVATPEGTRFAEHLRTLDDLAACTPSLSRVLLLPRQTTAGRMEDEAMGEALRTLLQTLYLSGARSADRIRRVLGHRADGRRLVNVAVATAELPVARIRSYGRWRLALAGLQTLSEQAERPLQDSARVDTLFQRLDVGPLLDDFRDGPTAERVRARAAKLSGAADHLPERWRVAWSDGPAEVRRAYRVLFEPIAKPWHRRTDPTTDPDHEAMLRAVDGAEFDALTEADRRVLSLLDEELNPRSALAVLPAVEHALKRVLHDLDEELARDVPVLPSPEPPAPPDDPGLAELQEVVDGRPGPARTWLTLTALWLGVTLVGMLALSWLLAEPVPVGATTSTVLPPTRPEAWAAGAIAGLLTATAWQLGVLWHWRQATTAVLERRTHELAAAWRRGGAGQEREQAEQLLAVRRRRTAHDLHRRFGFALERLAAVRAAIRQTTQDAHAALVDLRVRPGNHPRQDDVSGLLGAASPLHHSLVAPDALPKLLEETDAARDPERWAAQILEGSWPVRSGLSTDLPCADTDAILATSDRALGPIRTEQLLHDGAARIRSFLASVPSGLGWGIEPLGEHGAPVHGSGRDERLVVAPRGLRTAVENALADSPVQLEPLWTDVDAPWVSLLATWEGFTTAEVLRGMGVR